MFYGMFVISVRYQKHSNMLHIVKESLLHQYPTFIMNDFTNTRCAGRMSKS